MGEVEHRAVGRPRDPSADDAIIGATLELIAESSFESLRVSDVAARARVSKATLYRRWPTKHDLVLAALRTTPPLEPVDRGSVREDLKTIFRQFIQIAEDAPVLSLLLALAAERLRRPRFARELDPFVAERTRPVQEALQRAIDRGELARGAQSMLTSELIAGTLLLRLFFGGPSGKADVDALVDQVLDAFGATR